MKDMEIKVRSKLDILSTFTTHLECDGGITGTQVWHNYMWFMCDQVYTAKMIETGIALVQVGNRVVSLSPEWFTPTWQRPAE